MPRQTMRKGRFQHAPDPHLEALNASIGFDKRLYAQDIAGSKAHSEMLAHCGILTKKESEKICEALDAIAKEIAEERFPFDAALEDIHMNIEAALGEKVGAALAGKLHTARSRNDQVALDFRLYIREEIDGLQQALRALQKALVSQARAHAATIMPGFTHLQNGQPITFGHHCLAYVEMLARDRARLKDARRRVNQNPLGAGALAGTSFPIDRQRVAKTLRLEGVAANALDAVSDRDFALETLSAAAIIAMHLSRLAEEIVLWASPAFAFVSLPEAYMTGSSMMPQKKNPDAAELIRAQLGRAAGAFTDLLIVMKALPLAYAKDMQQDKEAVFQSLDALKISLPAMTGMIAGLKIHQEAMRRMAAKGYPLATDLADWLVQEKKVPFREAHAQVGALIRRAEKTGGDLAKLQWDEIRAIIPSMTQDAYDGFTLEKAVARRVSYGGTAPKEVSARAEEWRERLIGEKPERDQRKDQK